MKLIADEPNRRITVDRKDSEYIFITAEVDGERDQVCVSAEELWQIALNAEVVPLCPPHASIGFTRTLRCIACERNERQELRNTLTRIQAALAMQIASDISEGPDAR